MYHWAFEIKKVENRDLISIIKSCILQKQLDIFQMEQYCFDKIDLLDRSWQYHSKSTMSTKMIAINLRTAAQERVCHLTHFLYKDFLNKYEQNQNFLLKELKFSVRFYVLLVWFQIRYFETLKAQKILVTWYVTGSIGCYGNKTKITNNLILQESW